MEQRGMVIVMVMEDIELFGCGCCGDNTTTLVFSFQF